MPFNEEIDFRILEIVGEWDSMERKKMFGGTCHLLNGNMVCGVYKDYLIVRVGKEQFGNALRLPHTKPFDITGRPMKGWVMVEQAGFASRKDLQGWLNLAIKFVQTLPAK